MKIEHYYACKERTYSETEIVVVNWVGASLIFLFLGTDLHEGTYKEYCRNLLLWMMT